MTFLAFLFFFLAAFKCWLTVSETVDYKVFLGYWGRELPEFAMTDDKNYCISWDSATKGSLFDGSWKFGKAVGVVGSILAILVFVLSFYILFYTLSSRFFSYLACTNVTLAVFSLLLLVGLGSDVCAAELCRLGPGGYMAILDFFLWSGAAVLAYRLRSLARAQELENEPAGDKSTASTNRYPAITDGVEHDVEEIENDDGTITRETTITTKTAGGRKKRVDKVKRLMPPEDA